MQQTSKMLATVSEYAGFVIAPNIIESRINYIELVNLGGNKILVLIVTEENLVKHRVINCKYDIQCLKIKEIAELLNDKFRGKRISELKDNIIDLIIQEQKEKDLYVRFFSEIIENLENIFENKSYYLDESPKLMDNLDFESSPYKILKQQEVITNLLTQNLKGVQVYIGDTGINSSFKNCSVITSSYKVGEKTVGVLGIIGPKRMNYDKMVSLVEYISKLVNKMIEEK
jgi:heat-inducible transcriptional repressor